MKYLFFLSIICLSLNCCVKQLTNEEKNNASEKYLQNDDSQEVESMENEIVNELLDEDNSDESIYNYANGNGTIIEKVTVNNITWTIRKHEDDYINELFDEDFNVYEILGDNKSNIVFVLSYNMKFKILELAYSNKRRSDNDLWLKIKNEDDITGWVNVRMSYYNPYKDGAWSIVEILVVDDKTFTIRKVQTQWLNTISNLDVRSEPSLNGNILFNLGSESKLVTILEMTEETEIIDGKNEPWLKIIDNSGNTGWIFGGYAFVDGRGGFKYKTPHLEAINSFIPW